jgi:hypothetical protein
MYIVQQIHHTSREVPMCDANAAEAQNKQQKSTGWTILQVYNLNMLCQW